MKAVKIIKTSDSSYGFLLDDQEFEKRKVDYNSDNTFVECFLENGTICLVPTHLWEDVEEPDNTYIVGD